MKFDNALAVYGTLRPGESNHWVVKNIKGEWVEGVVRGYAFEVTWGEYDGYPGFVPDENGNHVPVSILVSDSLPQHIDRIDDFEGAGYERRPIQVRTPDGADELGEAGIYVTLTDHE